MDIDFIKCHGSGNTFVLVGDPRYKFKMADAHLSDFAKKICSKNSNASDGLLIVQKDFINNNDSCMRMFNPDGSEAEMCGNGLRCVARETMEVLGLDSVVVSTFKSQYKASKEREMSDGVYTVSVEMGAPIFDPKEIPVESEMKRIIDEQLPIFNGLSVSILGMPNPHIVAIISEAEFPWDTLEATGKLVNAKKTRIFPKGGNVNFIQKISENKFFVGTYERGAGLTPSCGSGMTASSIVACMLKQANFSENIVIYNNGGFVKIKVDKNPINKNYQAKLTGNATYIFRGKTSYSKEIGVSNSFDAQLNSAEVDAYKSVMEVIPFSKSNRTNLAPILASPTFIKNRR